MANIFGPGHHPSTGESATRPTQTPTAAPGDRWFVPCDPVDPNSGTSIDAEWLNFMLANMRAAIRGMGVPEDEVDDLMLLKCFQKQSVSNWLNLPFYPEVTSSGNALSVSNQGGGVLEVNSGQTFTHRGWTSHNTANYTAAQRRVNTIASKTYHLRWQYNAGNDVFVLKDVADAAYNPGALPEINTAFDSKFDDMLIAKVVTDGSNAPTITSLKNLHVLDEQVLWVGKLDDPGVTYNHSQAGNQHAQKSFSTVMNWARTPKVEVVVRTGCVDSMATGGADSFDGDVWVHPDGPMPANDGTDVSTPFRGEVAGAQSKGKMFRSRYAVGTLILLDQYRFVTAAVDCWAP